MATKAPQAESALTSIRNAYDDLYDQMRYGSEGSVEFANERLLSSVRDAEGVCTVEPWLSEYEELRSMLGSVGLSTERIK